jgi:hypothetical protein
VHSDPRQSAKILPTQKEILSFHIIKEIQYIMYVFSIISSQLRELDSTMCHTYLSQIHLVSGVAICLLISSIQKKNKCCLSS